MTRAVIDTNILVSGFLSVRRQTSAPAEVIRRWQLDRFELLTSQHVLDELAEVFEKRYFQQIAAADAVRRAIDRLHERATIVTIEGSLSGIATHLHDDPILETAVAGNADFLVTGDHELLHLGSYKGIAILTPAAFLRILDSEELAEH